MRKIFYENWLARFILPFAHTITIGPFVFTKREAVIAESDDNNLGNAHYFLWVKYL